METRYEKVLVGAAVVAALVALLNIPLAREVRLLVPAASIPFLLLAALVSLAAHARTRLARRAEEEQRDEALARKEQAESALFKPGDFEPFTIARSRALFETYVVPLFTPLLVLVAGLAAWHLWARLSQPAFAPGRALLAAAFLAAEAFLLFLASRYLLGLSRASAYRLYRAPGVWVGLSCLAAAAGAVAAVLVELGLPAADRWVTQGLAVALAVLAAELALNAVADLYRPRRAGAVPLAYETRVGRLLTDPKSWARSLAQTLDYQFGFNVSETWFFRFLEKAVLPLLLFQLVALYALTCLVFIGPEEEGILERFGRPLEGQWHLASGFRPKWPWPFETVRRFPARRVLTLDVGYHEAARSKPSILLWTVPHYEREDYFLVASRASAGPGATNTAVPVSLLAMNVPLEYRITNVYQYAYMHSDPRRVLEQIAARSLSLEAVGHDLGSLLGAGRQEASAGLARRIQADADRLGLGVQILSAGLQDIHPPPAVAEAFQSVVGALEVREATILSARAYAARVVPLAAADAEKAAREAEAYQVRRVEESSAETARFLKQVEACRRSPAVFRARTYLGTLRDALAHVRKYIVAAPTPHEVIQFNFEEKLHPDLFDLGPGSETRKGTAP